MYVRWCLRATAITEQTRDNRLIPFGLAERRNNEIGKIRLEGNWGRG